MISQFYKEMTGKESVIRKFFDYSRQRAAELGPDSVYNFSIGNPSVPVPQKFTDAMTELLEKEDVTFFHDLALAAEKAMSADAEKAMRVFAGL